MWVFLFCFRLWSLANHSGKISSHLLVEQDEMTSLSIEGETEKGLAPFLSCGTCKGGDHDMKGHQVFVLWVNYTDRYVPLTFYCFISRTHKSRYCMWLFLLSLPFGLFKECTTLRLFCCGLTRHGLLVVRGRVSVAEEGQNSICENEEHNQL